MAAKQWLCFSVIAGLAASGCNMQAGGSGDLKEIKETLKQIQDQQKEVLEKMKSGPAAPQRPQMPQPDFNKVWEIPVGSSPVKGKADALVTISVFSDFQCPYCARSVDLVMDMLKAFPNDVKIAFKQFPLSFHQNARPAALAALAAGRQGKFWEMHDVLFQNFQKLEKENIANLAKGLSLNMAKFEKDWADPALNQQIEDEMALAQKVGVRGTPTMFVNGKLLRERSPEGFKKQVEDALAEAKKVR